MRNDWFIWVALTVTVGIMASCSPRPAPTPAPATSAPTPAVVATTAPATPAPAPVTPASVSPGPAPATPSPAPGAKLPPILSIATAGVGTTSYIAASAFAEVLGKYAGTKVTVEPSGATTRWVPLMKTKEIDMAIGCLLPDVQDAYFGKFFWADKGPQPVLHVATGQVQPYGFVVTDPKIKTIADLKGKKVYADQKGARVYKDTLRVLFQAAGLQPEDAEVLTFSDVNEATKGVAEGRAIGLLYVPSVLPIVELDRTKSLYGIPVPKETADKVTEALAVTGFTTWKKGDGISKEDIPYMTMPCGLLARADLDEGVVYTVLSTIYAHYDEYKDKHPIMKWWTSEQAVSLIPVPVHPGAIQYFKDRGVWRAEQEKLQQKWLAQPRG